MDRMLDVLREAENAQRLAALWEFRCMKWTS
jgi:hypothetical protein